MQFSYDEIERTYRRSSGMVREELPYGPRCESRPLGSTEVEKGKFQDDGRDEQN